MNLSRIIMALLLTVIVADRSVCGQPGGIKKMDKMVVKLEAVVEEMRGLDMRMSPSGRSDGRSDPLETKKEKIVSELAIAGPEGILVLAKALNDRQALMRRNVCLTLVRLTFEKQVQILPALPYLIRATEDSNADVRAYAAHAIAEIGPNAAPAVPNLVKLLNDSDEGTRNNSAMALGAIGPAAAPAIPALKDALKDKSKDVRSFAKGALESIAMVLNSEIKAARAGSMNIYPENWGNPSITIYDEHVTVGWNKGERHSRDMQRDEVARFLVSLPVSAWPYGRTVAVAYCGITAGTKQTEAYRKQSRNVILNAMKRLNVSVSPVPSS